MPLNEKQFDFYFEEVCPHGDEVLRLSYLLLLNKQAAWTCVSKTFDRLVDKLTSLEDDLTFQLVSNCWKTFKAEPNWPQIDESAFTKDFAKLSIEERSAIAVVDLIGLTPEEAAKALDRSHEQVRTDLSHARQKLLRVDFA